MLRKKARPRLKSACLAAFFSFHRNQGTDRITITLAAAKTESDRRRQVRHDILQKPQLRTITIFQEYFQPPIPIEIGEGEGPTVLQKVQAHHAGNIGKSPIPIVRVEDVPFKSAPRAVGADEFIDCGPSLFIIGRRLGFRGGVGNHLPPKKTVQILFSGWAHRSRDHAIRDVEIGEAVVVKIPCVARPRPAAHFNSSGSGRILKSAVALITK